MRFDSEEGTYKLCFSNEFSTITHKTIYFNIRPAETSERLAVDPDKGSDRMGQFEFWLLNPYSSI